MTTPIGDAQAIKACCATAYQSDLVALLLGETYHPGGTTLTRHLADQLGLVPRQRVLDLASGPGGTAVLLAREYGVRVDGVDLGPQIVAKATAIAEAAGLDQHVRFHHGDAERLPFDDALFDAVVCECAFCTFPDKSTAAAEIVRMLGPGGRVGITDITTDPAKLDTRLTGLAGWVACIADARPTDEYASLLEKAGLRVTRTERHDDALTATVDMIEARLRAMRIACAHPALAGVDLGTVIETAALARDAIARGTVGYALLIAEKPG